MGTSNRGTIRASLALAAAALAAAALAAMLSLSSFSCATGTAGSAGAADESVVKGFPILVTSGTVSFRVRVYSRDPKPVLRSEYTVSKKAGEALTQTARKGSVVRVDVENLGRELAEIETDGRKLVIGNARGSETKMTFIVD